MGNWTSKNDKFIIVVITIMMSFYSMRILQKSFEIRLLNSEVKSVSENDPYKRFIDQAIEEGKKREAEIVSQENVRIESEQKMVAKEKARIENEQKIAANEKTRIESEKKSAIKEKSRVDTEKKRALVVNTSNDANLSRGGLNIGENTYIGIFKVTAYNLSESSCRKLPSSPLFGITCSGYNLKGKDLKSRKIAVDPKRISIGSTVYLEFPKDYNTTTLSDGTRFELNGVYQAVDVGGGIKGDMLDVFVGGLGEETKQLACKIGVRQVKVYK